MSFWHNLIFNIYFIIYFLLKKRKLKIIKKRKRKPWPMFLSEDNRGGVMAPGGDLGTQTQVMLGCAQCSLTKMKLY